MTPEEDQRRHVQWLLARARVEAEANGLPDWESIAIVLASWLAQENDKVSIGFIRGRKHR